ncbi:hypothetical protein MPNT_370011 [Candidatus Methylacidithermus pantelleriae]|uniref:Uncharacterized protein n=1 Tax=Candidatus Methylacidithermus pantelleriae TaxID=2744239 RepID=A0A8J2BMY7_9BACT|nr:hypothetical protein MPNT_370011 [Candidatus Methylacidithermus pantelleriae]
MTLKRPLLCQRNWIVAFFLGRA